MSGYIQLIDRLRDEEENGEVDPNTVGVIGEAADAIETLEDKLAEVTEQSVARGDRVIELEHSIVEEHKKVEDVVKFAEKAYEEVCAERDSVTESYERMKHARTVALRERDAAKAERDRLAAAVAEVMPILNMDGERHPKLEAALKAARGERS